MGKDLADGFADAEENRFAAVALLDGGGIGEELAEGLAEFGTHEVGTEDAVLVGFGEGLAAVAEVAEGVAVETHIAWVQWVHAGEGGKGDVAEDVADVGAGVEHGLAGLPP